MVVQLGMDLEEAQKNVFYRLMSYMRLDKMNSMLGL